MKKKYIKKFISSLLISFLVIILTITLPFIGIKDGEELHNIFSVFIGNKSEYQGVIEIWNIDTFDSGTAPKSNYINLVAKGFEKQNKGTYIMVKNLSEYECLNLLERGFKPDLFSCSYGIASEIKDYLEPFSNIDDILIDKNLLNAGKLGNYTYGLAWCYGYYTLISSLNHLKNASFFNKFNINENDKFKLSDFAYKLGYEIKKPAKVISSLTYGNNKYLLPKYALESYNNSGLNNKVDFDLDPNVKENTSYDAYCKFISGSSVMLLGTQRDKVRINGRVENGKISDVIFEEITTFTDLIQYIFLVKGDNLLKQQMSERFAKLLVSSEYQSKLSLIKMNSTLSNINQNSGVMTDITLDFMGICKVNNVFISKSEIFNLQ